MVCILIKIRSHGRAEKKRQKGLRVSDLALSLSSSDVMAVKGLKDSCSLGLQSTKHGTCPQGARNSTYKWSHRLQLKGLCGTLQQALHLHVLRHVHGRLALTVLDGGVRAVLQQSFHNGLCNATPSKCTSDETITIEIFMLCFVTNCSYNLPTTSDMGVKHQLTYM